MNELALWIPFPSYSGEDLGLASSDGDRLCSLSMEGGLTLSEEWVGDGVEGTWREQEEGKGEGTGIGINKKRLFKRIKMLALNY